MTALQIAIDGPAGAGKSTAAQQVAAALGYLYIDTGAMYRAIALLALEQGIGLDDGAALIALAQGADLRLEPAAQGCRVLLNGVDVSQAIRRPQVGNAASAVSAVAGVRTALVCLQQAMAASRPVVMDGRDIGTVVLPKAGCKIFLTASPAERARRRGTELAAKGLPVDLAQIQAEIEERDQRDSNRAVSPLRQAADAVRIDSSHMTLAQVVAEIIRLAKEA